MSTQRSCQNVRSHVAGLATLIAMLVTAPAKSDDPQVAGLDRHKIVRVSASTQTQADAIVALTGDVWSHGYGVGTFDVRVPADGLQTLDRLGVKHTVLIPDVQAAIDAERAEIERRNLLLGDEWFENYHNYPQIRQYIEELAARFPDLTETFWLDGESHQGRRIKGIRFTGPGSLNVRPAVFFNGCQHAREWISPATVTYLVEQLLEGYETDPAIRRLVDGIEFHFVPVVNPDGYVYTWTTFRLWRKNRRDNGDGTFGVDLNRNWSYEWGGVGSSPDPGNNLYRGPAPFSEPETTMISDYIAANERIEAHIDFHSYRQLVLSAWAFTATPPPDDPLFDQLNAAMSDAIRGVHGKVYTYGSWYTNLYPSSGVMTDWTYGDRGILSWTLELRDTGQYGFLLPPDQIIPTGQEAFAGVRALLDWVGPIVPGDLNCDGDLNAFDIEPFLTAMFEPDEYGIQYPECDADLADLNFDGAVNAFDIEPFLNLLFP